MTIREIVTTRLNESQVLRDLGLAEGSVYQADTADNVLARPFVVLRWMEVPAGIGAVTVRPAQAWVYDDAGDFTRAERIGAALLGVVAQLEGIVEDGSVLMMTRTVGEGLGRGRDFYDDGYKAIVIPHNFVVVGTGQ